MSVNIVPFEPSPSRLSFALNVFLFIALSLSLLPRESAALARNCVEPSPLVNSAFLAQSGKIRQEAAGNSVQLPSSTAHRSARVNATLVDQPVSFIRCVPRTVSLGG